MIPIHPRVHDAMTPAGSGPSLSGTGETPDLNWQRQAQGLAGSAPVNAHSPPNSPQKFPAAVLHSISPSRRTLFP